MLQTGLRVRGAARAAIVVVIGAASWAVPARAQIGGMQPLVSPAQSAPGSGPVPTVTTTPGPTLLQPQAPVPAAPAALSPQVPALAPAGQVALYLSARLGRDQPAISNGLVWRIYQDKPDAAGQFRLVREERTPAPALVLPPGGYIVHASFGQASASKQLQLQAETVRETFEIPAGGITLKGQVGEVRIPPSQITFDLYKGSQFEPGDKRALAQGVASGDVVLVPEGVYTIVSNYGDGNAVVRSDIRVQTGKVTDVTVNHRAAVITLKLVSDSGDALANTAWSVLTPGGDVIKESIGAFPRVVLAEGEYKAIARNEGKMFERNFKVVAGVDTEISVTAR